jgi:hypothetical protein
MRKLLTLAICLGCTLLAAAQDKIESKWHCLKPTTEQKADIGDTAGHAYALAQGTCNATSSSLGEKTGTFTESQEVWTNSVTVHGRFITTTDAGDKLYYTYEGKIDPAKNTGMNKWRITGGTGKQKATKGSGTCSGTMNKDETSDWTCTGTLAPGQ